MSEGKITSEVMSTTKDVVSDQISNGMNLVGKSFDWVNNNQSLFIEYGLNIIAAILTIVIGLIVARMISGAINKVLIKRKLDITVVDFVSHLAKYVIVAFVLIAALSRIGVQTTSFIAIIGAAGLAIGLALQGSLSNFASGVLIIILRPFKAGEYIDAAGVSGSVESVQIFATTLITPDNKFVVVPNSAILSGSIINYSRKATRRIDITIGVSYKADLAKTKAILEAVLKDNELILKSPQALVAVSELAASSVNFVVRPWVKSSDYWGVHFALMEAIKNALDEAGIGIPYPQMDVHMNKLDE